MSKVRVLKNLNNTVSIIYPAPNSKRPDETNEQWLERVFIKANPDNFPYVDMDNSELPQNRDDRGAWEFDENSKTIKINQIKAKQLRDEKIIQERMVQIQDQEKRELAIAELKKEGKL